MNSGCAAHNHSCPPASAGWPWSALARRASGAQWHALDLAHRSAVERPPRALSPVSNLPSAVPAVGARWRVRTGPAGAGHRLTGAWRTGSLRVLHRRHLRGGETRGKCVGKTTRGNGTTRMAMADRTGLPLAVHVDRATPHEVTLVVPTLAACFVDGRPARLIGDKAYDSDALDQRVAELGVDMIAPHRANRVKPKTQDGRP